MPSERGWLDRLSGNVIARVALYYAAVLVFGSLLWNALSTGIRSRLTLGPEDAMLDPTRPFRMPGGETTATLGQFTAFDVALAMIAAGVLALPVAWLYVHSRHKKGYRQSVVQTLVMLPIVVAGVVMLVKHSLALAFSLAGIVAAVRFRNTLEDSKDAVFIFFATALGIAAAVDVTVAVVISVIFSIILVSLWSSDFGRAPAAFEGTSAERRLQRAIALVNRTGSFVARVDDELLKSLSPDQLDALADRAWRRRKRHDPTVEPEQAEAKYDHLLRIHTTDVQGTIDAAEPVLRAQAIRWRRGGVVHETDGTHYVEFCFSMRDGESPQAVRDAVRRSCATVASDVALH